MFLVELIVVNIFLVGVISLYCKLTCGICKCSRHLVGKVVIVTGGNAGIGYETARDLAERGARVILACRNEGRGTKARDQIIAQTGNEDVHFKLMDLASFASVRKFADDVLKTEKRLDILVNNAGVFISENEKTEDGLAVGMQINHFGPFLLTNLLLPLLKSSAPSRIINVSSMVYKYGNLDFDNLNLDKEGTFGRSTMYSNTKLCNVLMTVELDRQFKESGVTAYCLHPGAVATEIMGLKENSWLKRILPLARLFIKDAWEGAQTSIFLAVSPEVTKLSGWYFRDCFEQPLVKKAQDPGLARKLWEVSERIVGLDGKKLPVT